MTRPERTAPASDAAAPTRAGTDTLWSWRTGDYPHTLYARELTVGGRIRVRFTVPAAEANAAGDGRRPQLRRTLTLCVRKENSVAVDSKLVKAAKEELRTMQEDLRRGIWPKGLRSPKKEPTGQTAGRDDHGPGPDLTIAEGVARFFAADAGYYAGRTDRYVRDVQRLAEILLNHAGLTPTTRWMDLTPKRVLALMTALVAARKRGALRLNFPRAVKVMDLLFAMAEWLRQMGHLPAEAIIHAPRWRRAFAAAWRTKIAPVSPPQRPRYTQTELAAMVGVLRCPVRAAYRALLPAVPLGGHAALRRATRADVVLEATGAPAAVRLRVVRQPRTGAPVEQRLTMPLDAVARAIIADRLQVAPTPDARLFPVAEAVLTLDPRIALVFELGAELRWGQVIQVRRGDLSLFPDPAAPLGTLAIPGASGKDAPVLSLTARERAVVDAYLATVMRDAEAAYDPADPRTNYPLVPQGKLVRGIAKLAEATPAKAWNRSQLRTAFRALEAAAGVPQRRGRGHHGMRRSFTDLARTLTTDATTLDALGGWRSGSTTRQTTYEAAPGPTVRQAAGAVRDELRQQAMGTPATRARPTGPEASSDRDRPAGAPAAADVVLARLAKVGVTDPVVLAAVLAAVREALTRAAAPDASAASDRERAGVGSAVGSAAAVGPAPAGGDAVSRCGNGDLQERETGLEPATSSLEGWRSTS